MSDAASDVLQRRKEKVYEITISNIANGVGLAKHPKASIILTECCRKLKRI